MPTQQNGNTAQSISGVAASATTLALTQLTTLSAAAATGIGAIVAAGIVLFDAFRSRAHLYANDIVDRLENPFWHNVLAPIVDAKDAAVSAGTATYEQLDVAYKSLVNYWELYKQTAAEYATQGPLYAQVAGQSLDNLNGPQGKILDVPPAERYGQHGLIDAIIEKTRLQRDALALGVVDIPGLAKPVAVTKKNVWWAVGGALLLIIIIRKVVR